MHQAFVASASLKPMAQQLLQERTPAAYAGVEAYARRHAKEDAGALAGLVVGYAHVLDHDYAKAIEPLSRAKPHAGDLGDYVAYYLEVRTCRAAGFQKLSLRLPISAPPIRTRSSPGMRTLPTRVL